MDETQSCILRVVGCELYVHTIWRSTCDAYTTLTALQSGTYLVEDSTHSKLEHFHGLTREDDISPDKDDVIRCPEHANDSGFRLTFQPLKNSGIHKPHQHILPPMSENEMRTLGL
ncbi:MAG: hypothetical protein WAZ18_03445 [Alphaproteobacteria bacterium]